MKAGKIRISVLLAVAAAVCSGAALFRISQKVQTAEAQLRFLTESAEREKRTIRVLNAEWAYLNRPDRLETLARDALHMQPPQIPAMTGNAGDLPSGRPPAAPPRKPVFAAQPVSMAIEERKGEHKETLSAPPVPVPPKPPEVEPVAVQDGQSFQGLLNELTGAGKEKSR